MGSLYTERSGKVTRALDESHMFKQRCNGTRHSCHWFRGHKGEGMGHQIAEMHIYFQRTYWQSQHYITIPRFKVGCFWSR